MLQRSAAAAEFLNEKINKLLDVNVAHNFSYWQNKLRNLFGFCAIFVLVFVFFLLKFISVFSVTNNFPVYKVHK